MQEYFYRYRSIPALLDQFHELESGEIYFPLLKELNDPLEGLKEIVWKGDRIVWDRLFQHYVLCLTNAALLVPIGGEDVGSEIFDNLVFQTPDDLLQAPIREGYAAICARTMAHRSLRALVADFSKTTRTVYRGELLYYLSAAHSYLLSEVLVFLEGIVPGTVKDLPSLRASSRRAIAHIPKMLKLHGALREQLRHAEEPFFSSANSASEQMALIHEVRGDIQTSSALWMAVARDFPNKYLRALERLIFPEWHVACFVTDPTDASMWSHYAAGHEGMCLKFRATADSAGKPALDLNRRTSWSGDGTVGSEFVKHAFEPVDYDSGAPEIEFFSSLGRVPMIRLSRFWYSDQKGRRSIVGEEMRRDETAWRENYWKSFQSASLAKAPQWKHECEHRLIVHSNLEALSSNEMRKMRYRFVDLTGIVFGIRTSLSHKLDVMRIIEQKCVAAGRSDFEFHQAVYSGKTRKIEIHPLNLLKIDPSRKP